MSARNPTTLDDFRARQGQVRAVIAFGAGTLAFILVYGLRTDSRGTATYAVMVASLAVLLFFAQRRLALGAGLLWCLAGWGLLHSIGGLLRVPASWPTDNGGTVFYTLWLVPGVVRYDHLVHAFGFGATAWLCWQILRYVVARKTGVPPAPTAAALFLCAVGGMGFGAVNELVEFFASRALPVSNIGGYANAGWDLFANLVGILVAIALIAWRRP